MSVTIYDSDTEYNKYKVWCETENTWVYTEGYQSTEPLECPNNNTHTIIPDRTEVVDSIPAQEPRDSSGKLRVHQTSRKLGTVMYWTGVGDDTSQPLSVGGGSKTILQHNVGDAVPEVTYIDINSVENVTYLHEGYITWKDTYFDTISLEIVPTVTSTITSSGTNYNLYNGYLIVPAAGDGYIDIASDITINNGGLVYMPDDDLGNPPTAFWNAEWDINSKSYINITPAPYGNGRYNMFSIEVTLAKFINKIPLLGSGFIPLNSSDTDRLGSGMRIKITGNTEKELVEDHSWSMASILCMHRERTI